MLEIRNKQYFRGKKLISDYVHVIRDQFFSSEILLISDLEHAIPVEIINTGERAIAYGTGDMNRLEIRSIPPNSRAQRGDVVITSGLGGRYPGTFRPNQM